MRPADHQIARFPERSTGPFRRITAPTQGLDQDILDQWEGWLQRCKDVGILIDFFTCDDGACVWKTGNTPPRPPETAFVTATIKEFQHHSNVIWQA